MSQTITIDLPDEMYARVEEAATASGQKPEEWLLGALPALLPAEPASSDEEEPAFWHMPDIDAEWEALQAELARRRSTPRSREQARAETEAMLAHWFSSPMTEQESLELAMSEGLSPSCATTSCGIWQPTTPGSGV